MSGPGNETVDPSGKERTRKRISAISEVSALPLTIQKIISALTRETLSIQALDEMIRHDQALASKIVSVANSAFYHAHRGVHVNSLDQAILVLGSTTIINIAVGLSIFKLFPLPYRTLKQMWAHAYRVALASGFLASRIAQSDREIAFLAGLLHDMGKAVLLSVGDKEEIGRLLDADGKVTVSREEEVFHCSHMEAGQWFLSRISLPVEITLPVLHHHDFSEDAEHPFIVAPVCIAEGLVSQISDDEAADGAWSDTMTALSSKFGLDQSALDECSQLLEMEDEFIDSYFER